MMHKLSLKCKLDTVLGFQTEGGFSVPILAERRRINRGVHPKKLVANLWTEFSAQCGEGRAMNGKEL